MDQTKIRAAVLKRAKAKILAKDKMKRMPSPSKEEINSEVFNAIWDVIKRWDINDPNYYSGYAGGNGSHVKLILDSLYPVLRNIKINNVLDNEKK